jgi:type I restriction enzyme S subunit
MNAALLLDHYARIADAPDAIVRLRRFVLDLAVRGKLVEQDACDEPASQMLRAAKVREFSPEPNLAGWAVADVVQLLKFQYGKGLHANERQEDGPIPVFGSNGVVTFTHTALTENPAIIVGRKGSAGALNLCQGPSWTTDVAYFVEAPPYFSIRYLMLGLSALNLDRLGKGVKPGLSRSEAYALTMCVPPLAEQHRIVAKVDELMALCDQLEAARATREAARDTFALSTLARLNTADPESFGEDARFTLANLAPLTTRADQIKQLRQTILNLAVRGKLVEQDAADEPASELFNRVVAEKARLAKAGVIPRPKDSARDPDYLTEPLPATWLPIALGDVCNLVTSGSRGWGEFYAETGPGFVRAQNIRFGKLRLDGLACVNPPAKSEGARTQVAEGDLLIVITGAGVTNPALLDRDLGEAYVSQHVGLVRPSDRSLSRWLLLCLMADAGGRSELTARAYGAGKPGLNLDNIRSLSVPLPPLAEQNRIVAKVDGLMALCDGLEASLTTGEQTRSRLLEAVLHHALEPA